MNIINRLKSFVRDRSAPAEFCFMLLLWIGVSLLAHIALLVRGFNRSSQSLSTKTIHISNLGSLLAVIYPLMVLTAARWIGRIRGWSVKSFGLRPTWSGTAAGIFLFFVCSRIYRYNRMLLHWIYPTTPPVPLITSDLTLPVILLAVVVNPIFEESFWEGYLFHALQRYGMWVTVLTSTLLRTLCHAHLGMNAVILIMPMGLAYTLIYWRWRQLWPLVVAHALEMLYSLLRMFFERRPPFSLSDYGTAWLYAETAAFMLCLCLGLYFQKRKIHGNAVIQ
jgi:uncharacterized protein